MLFIHLTSCQHTFSCLGKSKRRFLGYTCPRKASKLPGRRSSELSARRSLPLPSGSGMSNEKAGSVWMWLRWEKLRVLSLTVFFYWTIQVWFWSHYVHSKIAPYGGAQQLRITCLELSVSRISFSCDMIYLIKRSKTVETELLSKCININMIKTARWWAE